MQPCKKKECKNARERITLHKTLNSNLLFTKMTAQNCRIQLGVSSHTVLAPSLDVGDSILGSNKNGGANPFTSYRTNSIAMHAPEEITHFIYHWCLNSPNVCSSLVLWGSQFGHFHSVDFNHIGLAVLTRSLDTRTRSIWSIKFMWSAVLQRWQALWVDIVGLILAGVSHHSVMIPGFMRMRCLAQSRSKHTVPSRSFPICVRWESI